LTLDFAGSIFSKSNVNGETGMFIGFVILVAGILLLLSKMGYISGGFWDYIWPILLIALGAKIIFDRKKHK